MRKEFSQTTRRARFEHCKNADGEPRCEYCGGPFSPSNPPEYHHHVEAESKGDNSFENCRVIGKKCCHQDETSKFKTACAKSDRLADREAGLHPRPRRKILSRGFERREARR